MNAITPCIPKRAHLLRFSGNVICSSIIDRSRCRGPLKVRVELDAVRRVEVDALHLAAQALALGERRHHLQAVAEDHPVRPVGIVLVELRPGIIVREPVEVGKQVRLELRSVTALPSLRAAGLPAQIIDQYLGMHLLLNEQGGSRNDKIGSIALILATPDELWIEIAIPTSIRSAERTAVGTIHDGLELSRRDVLARGGTVGQRGNLLRWLRHGVSTGRGPNQGCTQRPVEALPQSRFASSEWTSVPGRPSARTSSVG